MHTLCDALLIDICVPYVPDYKSTFEYKLTLFNDSPALCQKGEIAVSMQSSQSSFHGCCVHIITVTTGFVEIFRL